MSMPFAQQMPLRHTGDLSWLLMAASLPVPTTLVDWNYCTVPTSRGWPSEKWIVRKWPVAARRL